MIQRQGPITLFYHKVMEKELIVIPSFIHQYFSCAQVTLSVGFRLSICCQVIKDLYRTIIKIRR
jgi:hypothetical protein